MYSANVMYILLCTNLSSSHNVMIEKLKPSLLANYSHYIYKALTTVVRAIEAYLRLPTGCANTYL